MKTFKKVAERNFKMFSYYIPLFHFVIIYFVTTY